MAKGTVEGTGGNDRINPGYRGDPEGDRIDNNDATIPGAGPNDDVVYAYGGDDTVVAGLGDDLVYGGSGNDRIFGGSGDDSLVGDDGNDRLDGGTGDDAFSGGLGIDEMFGGDDQDTFRDLTGGDFVFGGSGGNDTDTLDLTGSNFTSISFDPNNNEDGTVTFQDGTVLTFRDIERIIPCFTPGTMIATPTGERPVEELQAGDRVVTRDNGIQQIRWIGSKVMTGEALLGAGRLQPVLIRSGALGNGLPERDMLVSPNHRILVSNDRTQLYFEETEVLAAAKHLTGKPGIQLSAATSVTYVHFMFDRHEVVLSNGAWTESFQPGDWSLKGIDGAQRAEIFDIFPELRTKGGREGYQAARRSLKRHEARLLTT